MTTALYINPSFPFPNIKPNPSPAMICLYAETHLSNLTFFIYTFLVFPILRILQSLATLVVFLIDPHRRIETGGGSSEWEIDLPVSEFRDLKGEEEEMCSICLTEFAEEDAVNKLPRCGHVFHVGCLERWLDRCQFTCPLCRSFLLKTASPSSSSCTHIDDP